MQCGTPGGAAEYPTHTLPAICYCACRGGAAGANNLQHFCISEALYFYILTNIAKIIPEKVANVISGIVTHPAQIPCALSPIFMAMDDGFDTVYHERGLHVMAFIQTS